MASAGDQSPPSRSFSTVVLASGKQCRHPPDNWRATWITSPESLRRFTRRCHADRIGGIPADLKTLDFNRFGLLGVEIGQRPTSGYGVERGTVTATLENQNAVITLTCRRPAPGAINAQVVTSPWILIRLPRGTYRTIILKDQHGQALTRLTVK
jgi:hypothetical protein